MLQSGDDTGSGSTGAAAVVTGQSIKNQAGAIVLSVGVSSSGSGNVVSINGGAWRVSL